MTGGRRIVPYINQLIAEIDGIRAAYLTILEDSVIANVHSGRHGNRGAVRPSTEEDHPVC